MVRALLAIVKAVRRVWILELTGAGLVIAGVAVEWGTARALLAGGGLALLKAFDEQLGSSE